MRLTILAEIYRAVVKKSHTSGVVVAVVSREISTLCELSDRARPTTSRDTINDSEAHFYHSRIILRSTYV